jgi:hypothetical protein
VGDDGAPALRPDASRTLFACEGRDSVEWRKESRAARFDLDDSPVPKHPLDTPALTPDHDDAACGRQWLHFLPPPRETSGQETLCSLQKPRDEGSYRK